MFGVEVVAALIGLGGIALAYLIINYSLKEKTFEEALAEQRGAQQLLVQDGAGKASKKDKGKKTKKKPQSGAESDTSPKEQHRAKPQPEPSAPQPQVSSTPQEPSPATLAKKPSVKPLQPALVHPENLKASQGIKVTSKEVALATKQPAETSHESKETRKQTKDTVKDKDMVLPAAKEKDQGKEVGARKHNTVQLELEAQGYAPVSALPKGEAKAPVSHATKSPKPIATDKQKAASVKQQKPPVASQLSSNNDPVAGSDYGQVLGLLKSLPLTDAETQNLLQILIVKQSERHTEWVQLGKSKSVDPATIAKRMMEDKQQELRDEKEMNKVFAEQLKDMKNLLNQEKARSRELQETQRLASEKLPAVESELRNVTGRLKQTNEKHAVELAQLTRRLQEADTRGQSSLKALEEENRRLRLEHKPVQTETYVRSAEDDDITRELEVLRQERDALAHSLEMTRLDEQTRHQVDGQVAHSQHSRDATARESQELQRNIAHLTSELAEKELNVAEARRQKQEMDERCGQLDAANASLKEHLHQIQRSADQQAEQNEEDHLRRKLAELVGHVQELEEREKQATRKADLSRNAGFEEAKSYYEPQVDEAQKVYRQLLSRLYPSVHIDKQLAASEWLKEFENAASKIKLVSSDDSSHQMESVERELHELREIQASLHSEVDRYRTALSETEGKLHDLQISVETEEEKWVVIGRNARDYEDKCKNLETQLSEVLGEKDNVHKLLQERSSSVGELEHRLREAEERLQAFSSVQENLDSLRAEADRLKKDLSEVHRHKDELHEEANQLRSSLTEANFSRSDAEKLVADLRREVVEVRNHSHSAGDANQDVSELRHALAAEKDNARKLAQEIVKNKSVIQTGLESLRQEQETVSKLKESLESRGGMNGTISGGPGGDNRADGIARTIPEENSDSDHKSKKSNRRKKLLKALVCS